MNLTKISIYLTIVLPLFFSSNLYSQFANPTLIESNTGLIINFVTADLNNDNLEDIIVIKKFSDNSLISYYLNQGGFNFSQEVTIATGSSQVTNISIGDFNNDNWLDIVSIGDATNSVTLYMNNELSFSAEDLDSFTFFESDIEVADLDNDNDLDIIGIGGTTFKVYYNDGMANFTSQTVETPLEDFFDITVGDIDADGFQDVITGGSNVSVYKNNSGVLIYDSIRSGQVGQVTGTFSLFLRLSDLDNDGDVDLFREGNNSTGAIWMENDGNGNFSNSQIIDSDVTNIRSCTLNDLDNDDDLDIIIIKDFNLYLYTNEGLGNFSQPLLIQDAQSIISVIHSEDMNNDGFADIIWSADLTVQENNLALSTPEHIVSSDLVKIYPNPTTENLFLNSSQDGVLDILNSRGQLIYKNVPLREGGNNLILELNPQLYFFNINLKMDGIITEKVLIE
jgi:hypothetical protein